jgi:hypothetical protein
MWSYLLGFGLVKQGLPSSIAYNTYESLHIHVRCKTYPFEHIQLPHLGKILPAQVASS